MLVDVLATKQFNKFLDDPHRLGVANSRARFGLHIIGTKSIIDESRPKSLAGFQSAWLRYRHTTTAFGHACDYYQPGQVILRTSEDATNFSTLFPTAETDDENGDGDGNEGSNAGTVPVTAPVPEPVTAPVPEPIAAPGTTDTDANTTDVGTTSDDTKTATDEAGLITGENGASDEAIQASEYAEDVSSDNGDESDGSEAEDKPENFW